MPMLVRVIMIKPRRMEIHGSAGEFDFLVVFSFLVLATICSGRDLVVRKEGWKATPPLPYVLINPLKGFGNGFLPAFVLLVA